MSHVVKARMKLDAVRMDTSGAYVDLSVVITDDKNSPNYSFSKYTPNGTVKLNVTNPAAIDLFVEAWKEKTTIDITFEPTPYEIDEVAVTTDA